MKNITLYGLIEISKADQRSMQENILDNVLSFDRLRDEIASFLEEKEFKRDLAKYGQELTTKKACYRWVQYGNLACYRDVMQDDLKRLFDCTDHELEKLIERNYLDDVDNMYFKLYSDQVYHIVMQDNDLQITNSDILNHAQLNDSIVIIYLKEYLRSHNDFNGFKNNYKYLLNKNEKDVYCTTIDFINAPFLDFEAHKQWKLVADFYGISKEELFWGLKENVKKNKGIEEEEEEIFNRIESLFVGAISPNLYNLYQSKGW